MAPLAVRSTTPAIILAICIFGVTVNASVPLAPSNVRVSTSGTTIAAQFIVTPAEAHNIGKYCAVFRRTAVSADASYALAARTVCASGASVHLSGVEEDALYEIFGYFTNILGAGPNSTVTQIKTDVGVPSNSPVITSSQAVSATEAQLSWLPPPLLHRNGPIIGYTVQYIIQPAGTTQGNMTVPGDATAAVVTGLSPHSTYHLRVAALTSAGRGVFSVFAEVRTQQSLPPAPVFTLSATSTSITVVVNVVGGSGYNVLKYCCTFRRPAVPGSNVTSCVHHGDVEYRGLESDTLYEVVAFAYNTEGRRGPQASAITISTQPGKSSGPVPPSHSPASHAKQTPPPPSHHAQPSSPPPPPPTMSMTLTSTSTSITAQVNVATTHYTVSQYCAVFRRTAVSDDKSYSLDSVPQCSTRGTMTFKGVEEDASYEVIAFVYNSAGQKSPNTSVHTIRTHPADPAAPTNLRLMARTKTSLTLAWKGVPLLGHNGLLSGYRIGYRQDEKDHVTWKTLPAVDTTYTITGLDYASTYSAHIESFRAGYTPRDARRVASPELTVDTDQDVPPAPTVSFKSTQSSIEVLGSIPRGQYHVSRFCAVFTRVDGTRQPPVTRCSEGTTVTLSPVESHASYSVMAFVNNTDGAKSPNSKTYTTSPSSGVQAIDLEPPTHIHMIAPVALDNLRLAWEYPSNPDHFTVIAYYRINEDSDPTVATITVNVEGSERSVVLSDLLRAGTGYAFDVIAVTATSDREHTRQSARLVDTKDLEASTTYKVLPHAERLVAETSGGSSGLGTWVYIGIATGCLVLLLVGLATMRRLKPLNLNRRNTEAKVALYGIPSVTSETDPRLYSNFHPPAASEKPYSAVSAATVADATHYCNPVEASETQARSYSVLSVASEETDTTHYSIPPPSLETEYEQPTDTLPSLSTTVMIGEGFLRR